ncbi:MAG: peptidoglycan DD-metalloendopeptidase family protein [Sulfurovaceae bacterium]
MKNRVIITISDIRGTKSYSLSKLFRRFLFWIISFISFVAIGGAIFIPILTHKVMELTSLNELYQQDLENKISAYEELDEKFEALEEQITAYEKMSSPPEIFRQKESVASKEKSTAESRLAKLKSDFELKKFILKHIPNGSPVRRPVVTSRFGLRAHPIFKTKKMHHGVDMRVQIGSPVYAVADGIITRSVNRDVGGYGKLVVIRHKYGFSTAYAHLSGTKVKIGDIVKKGQVIALGGNSGRSTGPHLHYEVHYRGKAINPSTFISWSMVNYNKIFTQQKDVPWGSLIKRIRS